MIAGGTREESGRESTKMALNSFPHPFNLSTLQPFNPFITQSRRETEPQRASPVPKVPLVPLVSARLRRD